MSDFVTDYVTKVGVKWIINPANKWDKVVEIHGNQAIVQTAGLIPHIVDQVPDDEPVIDTILSIYGFNPDNLEGFVLSKDGTIDYLGDNPMYPIMETKLSNVTIRIYPNAYVSFYTEESFKTELRVYKLD